MAKFATREELYLVQEILDKFQYPYLLELHLDKYWMLSLDNEMWSGNFPDELEYRDDIQEGVRLSGDFAMVNVKLCTGIWITKIFDMEKMVTDDNCK